MRKKMRENKKYQSKFEKRMRRVELLPTRDSEAGYGPACTVGKSTMQKAPSVRFLQKAPTVRFLALHKGQLCYVTLVLI